jgi:hypothetical protein
MLLTEDLFTYVYVLADDLITAAAIVIPPRLRPAPACSDAELLAIAIVRHLLSCRSEAGFPDRGGPRLEPPVPDPAAPKRGQPADPLAVWRVRRDPAVHQRALPGPRQRRGQPGLACRLAHQHHPGVPDQALAVPVTFSARFQPVSSITKSAPAWGFE